MKKKTCDLTIKELRNYFLNKCKEIDCDTCPFFAATCGSLEGELEDFLEDVGENTLIEVEDE